jgi:prepilin-type N-terminal cleavage/methylation domain-containing protein
MQKISRNAYGFTLIELFTVMIVIAIIFGIAYPVFSSIMERARKTQAKNDLTQIVTAVNAYYTEYGKYPLVAADTIYGPTGASDTNANLFYTLRAVALGANAADVANPRKIVFISPPDAKDPANPRSGIGTAAATIGQYFDPWGTQYAIAIDGGYNNAIANPYTLNAGATPLQLGVIGWSFGKDAQSQSVPGPAADKKAGTNDDDVISWQ